MIIEKFNVDSVNSLDDTFIRNYLTGSFRNLSSLIKLQHVVGRKSIYVVSFEEALKDGEYIDRLQDYNLMPCLNAPNYLLGLIKDFPDQYMPLSLEDKDIIAADPISSSIFKFRGNECFLYVSRSTSHRSLGLLTVGGNVANRRAFLAESLR